MTYTTKVKEEISKYESNDSEKIYELSGIRLGDNIFSKFNIVTKVKLNYS